MHDYTQAIIYIMLTMRNIIDKTALIVSHFHSVKVTRITCLQHFMRSLYKSRLPPLISSSFRFKLSIILKEKKKKSNATNWVVIPILATIREVDRCDPPCCCRQSKYFTSLVYKIITVSLTD